MCVYVVYSRVCLCVNIQQIDGSVDSLDFVAFRFLPFAFLACVIYLAFMYILKNIFLFALLVFFAFHSQK